MAASKGKAQAPGHRIKRWLYLVHRWIGIASCLLFATWLLSGLVMIYVPFPSLTARETARGQDAIDWLRVNVQPLAALEQAGTGLPRSMALEMRDASPVWRIEPWTGSAVTVPATAGEKLAPVDASLARRVAERFGGNPAGTIKLLDRDQWTVAGGFDRHRPLWKVSLADAVGTELYVSSASGGVVQKTDRRERFWNWVGSVPHWIYPTVLRQNNEAWRQVVMWVAGPCIAAIVTGMWIGILRVRVGKRRFRDGRIIPYRGWMCWHHIAGLTGGFALLTWMFSGWLSVDPFHLFASRGIATRSLAVYAHASPPLPLAPWKLATLAPDARRMTINWAAGRELLTIDRADAPVILDARTLKAPQRSWNDLQAAVRKLVPDASVISVQRLTTPDAYWYEVGSPPKLPILRVRFDDAAATWVHIDPDSGMLLGDLDARRRLYRWCFDLLHKWDLNGLTLNRPSWDILLWSLSIVGLVTSVSGILIAWRRLRRPRRGG